MIFNNLTQAIEFGISMNITKPVKMLSPGIEEFVREYAARRFKAYVIDAEKSGNHETAVAIRSLFAGVFGTSLAKVVEPDLQMWVIYKDPADFPGQTIARKHVIQRTTYGPTDEIIVDTIENLRTRFESQGFMNLGRHPDDDKAILEAWL